ncbi:MAG TPA: SprT-like domain-containing protein [Microbacteriaceae bacterium]|nr:SprT-like domain-containing protein [Microbacteriaceae bacterium]
MAELDRVRLWADALIALHLDPGWTFAFDTAKTRAGLCSYARKRISVSRHLAARYGDDEIHQVLLHEVAHALAGPGAGHGPAWLGVARRIGYAGGRLHDGAVAEDLAPWVGTCPRGHTHYRYRTPRRPLSCRLCGRGFDPANLITWRQRPPRP